MISGGNYKVKEQKNLVWITYFAIGVELAFSVIAGIILGHYVDKWIGTKTPWFTILGIILGMIAGFSLLIRMTKRKK
ncbi:MAG: AtpZ/AtpI family protein [Thermodesulfobacteriota bacterium]